MRDLLRELQTGEIGNEAADAVYEATKSAPNARERLGLSTLEWQAFAHGASLSEIAEWRYRGWPSSCATCHQHLDVTRDAWFARELKSGSHAPVHTRCFRLEDVEERVDTNALEDEATVQCPHCGESQLLVIDPATSGQFVQDCDVCCSPWTVSVARAEDGALSVQIELA